MGLPPNNQWWDRCQLATATRPTCESASRSQRRLLSSITVGERVRSVVLVKVLGHFLCQCFRRYSWPNAAVNARAVHGATRAIARSKPEEPLDRTREPKFMAQQHTQNNASSGTGRAGAARCNQTSRVSVPGTKQTWWWQMAEHPPPPRWNMPIACAVRHSEMAPPGGWYQEHSGHIVRRLAACRNKPHPCFSLSSRMATTQKTRLRIRPHVCLPGNRKLSATAPGVQLPTSPPMRPVTEEQRCLIPGA